MVRSATSRVSNHESVSEVRTAILRDAAKMPLLRMRMEMLVANSCDLAYELFSSDRIWLVDL
jgi:hypothetical protein